MYSKSIISKSITDSLLWRDPAAGKVCRTIIISMNNRATISSFMCIVELRKMAWLLTLKHTKMFQTHRSTSISKHSTIAWLMFQIVISKSIISKLIGNEWYYDVIYIWQEGTGPSYRTLLQDPPTGPSHGTLPPSPTTLPPTPPPQQDDGFRFKASLVYCMNRNPSYNYYLMHLTMCLMSVSHGFQFLLPSVVCFFLHAWTT